MKKIIILIAILLVILIGSIVLKIYDIINYKPIPINIAEYYNQKNGYRLLFKSIDGPYFVGNEKIQIILYDENSKTLSEKNLLFSNDGKSCGEGNITVKWLEDKVEISLKNDVQIDTNYEILYTQ